jgi:Family of unknown function (DUF5681)
MTSQYDVGYCKPPKKNQFQKGKSGNQKGRPKPPFDVRKFLITALKSTVNVVVDGEKKKISKMEAYLLSKVARALKGERVADKFLMEFITKYPFEDDETEIWTYRVGPEYRALVEQVKADAAAYKRE